MSGDVDRIKEELRAKNALVGKRFGRLVVVGELGDDAWLMRCDDCRHEFQMPGPDLRRKGRRPCGCDDKEEAGRRRAQRRALRVFAVTTGLAVVLVAGVLVAAWRYPGRPAGTKRGEITIDVPRGAGAQKVADILAAAGLVDRPALFRLYAGQRGAASRFKAGRYKFDAPVTSRALVDALVRGAPDELVLVTIPEGKNLLEIAEILDAAGVTPKAELVAKATDQGFALGLGLPGTSVEGYLYPDTYKLRPGTSAAASLTAFVKRQRQVLDELRGTHAAGAAALKRTLGFDEAQIVTLASIVEKETGQAAERPRIAQVFINRLTLPTFKPRLLQTDPTIIYGCTVAMPRSEACSRWDGRIRRIHLDDRQNPYNTYTHEGLPPGPIANPGRASLEAVLAPDRSLYLYFVSRNDGTHVFSRTLAEHEAAVVEFQRGGRPLPGRQP